MLVKLTSWENSNRRQFALPTSVIGIGGLTFRAFHVQKSAKLTLVESLVLRRAQIFAKMLEVSVRMHNRVTVAPSIRTSVSKTPLIMAAISKEITWCAAAALMKTNRVV
jgi:hypothetical protein